MKKEWETQALGDVLEVLRNGANCKQDKKGLGQKITRIETIAQAEFNLDKVGYSKLKESDKAKYKIERGDILFSHINSVIHVGKTALYNSDEELYHGINLLLMRPKDFLLPNYLEYFLKSLFISGYWRTVCKQSVNQASVNQQDIGKVAIHYPKSLPEQQRIVSVLDEAFASIADAKSNAERNLVNARELFEAVLEGYFGNGKDWEEKNLGEVLQKTETIDPTKTPNKEYVYIDVSSVNKENLSIEEVNLIKGKDAPSRARKLIKTNDVIFATVRPTLRRIAIVPEEYDNQICSTGYFVLRGKEFIDNRLIFYFLQTNDFMTKMEKLQKGASYPAVTDGEVRDQIIHFPKSLAEQRAIVGRLEALSAETGRLEEIYEAKVEGLEELKKSVLGKAFAGEL